MGLSLLSELFLAGAAAGLLIALFVAATGGDFRLLQWIALAVSLAAVAALAFVVVHHGLASPTRLNCVEAIVSGVAVVIGVWNFVEFTAAGSGGYNSTRDNARLLALLGVAIAGISFTSILQQSAPVPPAATSR